MVVDLVGGIAFVAARVKLLPPCLLSGGIVLLLRQASLNVELKVSWEVHVYARNADVPKMCVRNGLLVVRDLRRERNDAALLNIGLLARIDPHSTQGHGM